MSDADHIDSDEPLDEPLSYVAARALARRILQSGCYVFTKHAEERLAKREISQLDVINTIRAGECVHHTFESGTYRYQFETLRGYHAVVAFRSATEMVVVSAWK